MDTVASDLGRSKDAPRPGGVTTRAVALVAVFALASAAAQAWTGVLQSPDYTFAETRLMPLYVTAAGGTAYADPGLAPFYLPMYPPLSFLAYTPVLAAKSPVPALRAGAALCEAFVLLAAAVVVFAGASTAPRALAWAAAGGLVCWLHVSPVLTALFFVHADAPAVLLAAAGAALLVRAIDRPTSVTLAGSLVLLTLAPWAKQVFLPVVLLPTVVLWPIARRRALGCLAAALALEALWTAVFGAAFGARSLAFWTLTFPALHPWNAAPADALGGANRILVAEGVALVAFLGALVAMRRRPESSAGSFLREPAGVLAAAGLLLWPGSLVGHVKIGGSLNSFIPTLFFFSAAAVAGLVSRAAASPPARAALLLGAAVLAAQGLLDAGSAARQARHAVWDADFAFETVRRDPAHVFFPWNPLSTYLASGAFVPSEVGIADRDLAGLPPSREAFSGSLPGAVRWVLCARNPCPAVLSRLPVRSQREIRRGGTTWVVSEVAPPP